MANTRVKMELYPGGYKCRFSFPADPVSYKAYITARNALAINGGQWVVCGD